MPELFTKSGLSIRNTLKDATMIGGDPAPVHSCTCDWRHVKPGDVFVAVTGAVGDGHDDAVRATGKGATVVICERHLPVFGVTQFIVKDSRVAYGQLCQTLMGSPSDEIKVIGITGSAGKSSVVALLASVLHAADVRFGCIGSLGYYDGYDRKAACESTPNQPTLAFWLARMAANGCSHAIVEHSADALAESCTAGINLDAACITNVVGEHRLQDGSVENYRRIKTKIFDQLQPHGVAILNADDPFCCRALATLDQPALTFGLQKPAEVTAQIVEQFVGEQTFVLTAGDDSVGVCTSIVGEHHASNCLAAATVALAYGLDLTTIAHGLESVQRISGRLDRLVCGQEFGLWIDAADSPYRLRTCLKAVRNVVQGKVYCVFHPRVTNDASLQSLTVSTLGRLADETVICSPYAPSSMPSNVSNTSNRLGAIADLIRRVRPQDAIVIAGARDLDCQRRQIEELLYDSLGASLIGGSAV